MNREIKVIDLFAGPGGLAEGFSSIIKNKNRLFSICLSIEKDESAHKTLLLRSFCRQFKKNNLPKEYYEAVCCENIIEREGKIEELFKSFPIEYKVASQEAIKFELGKDSEKSLDIKIKSIIKNDDKWVLIGGPPCQAFSMAGRSRVGGISSEDHRVYLYKEYLKVIAKHVPAVFVMENVKGLLSAKVNDESVFDMMLNDLSAPYKVIKETRAVKYKIFSLVKKNVKKPKDYIINSEEYGIPQKRHRVILLGVREDIKKVPSVLTKADETINIEDVIDDLPPLRSGINRRFDKYEINSKGKEIRKYSNIEDNNENWNSLMNYNLQELIKLNGFDDNDFFNLKLSDYGVGSEYLTLQNKKTKPIAYVDWSSLSEIIYSGNTEEPNMNGILIYTSTSDSEGTLGGLVEKGEPSFLSNVFEKALSKASWCSSDPLCLDNDSGKGFMAVNLGACHSCCLLPETSCCNMNKFLDRGMLIGTLTEPKIGLFTSTKE